MNFEDMKGITLKAISNNGDSITFYAEDGSEYSLFHDQNCCEHVYVEDVIGDFNDLLGTPLTMAEEVSNFDPPPLFPDGYEPESYTWTFYKLATVKGYVTIRFFGESNGYYSESVSFGVIKGVN